MATNSQTLIKRTRSRGGFSLVETLIAAVLLLIVFFMMAQAYMRGRVLLDHQVAVHGQVAVRCHCL